MNKKQTLGQSIYSGLQKGLHIGQKAGQKAVEFGAIAKGVYETGQQLYSLGQTVAPMVSALI